MGQASRAKREHKELMAALHSQRANPSVLTRTVEQIQARSGPIPAADELEKYDRVLPGPADRIMKMAESEVAARQQLTDKALTAQVADDRRGRTERRIGQLCAFVLASLTLVLSYLAAINGAEVFGAIIGSLSIGSLCIAFIIGRRPAPVEE